MSAPRAHVYVKDAFIYYDRRRIYLAGGHSLPLSRMDRAVLECLERGESELGVLSHSLARYELGDSADEVARVLIETHSEPRSVLEIGEPIGVIEPEVIVCSFTPENTGIDAAPLIRKLRRNLRVLHLGFQHRVRGSLPSNASFEALHKAGQAPTVFRFVQWARSLVRFHTRSVLVLTSPQDVILFGDLAATHRSVVCLPPNWPPRTGIEDLLAVEAEVQDPLRCLQSLFYAVRMTPINEYPRMDSMSSSDLGTLFHYGIRNASFVGISAADQPEALTRIGRAPDGSAPFALPAAQPKGSKAGSHGIVLVLDAAHVGSAIGLIQMLFDACARVGLGELMLQTEFGRVDVSVEDSSIVCRQRKIIGAQPNPAVVVVIAGLERYLPPAIELMAAGIPTLIFPSQHSHPLISDRTDPRVAALATADEWVAVLRELMDPTSERRRAVLDRSRTAVAGWDLAARVVSLVRAANHPASVAAPAQSDSRRKMRAKSPQPER